MVALRQIEVPPPEAEFRRWREHAFADRISPRAAARSVRSQGDAEIMRLRRQMKADGHQPRLNKVERGSLEFPERAADNPLRLVQEGPLDVTFPTCWLVSPRHARRIPSSGVQHLPAQP